VLLCFSIHRVSSPVASGDFHPLQGREARIAMKPNPLTGILPF
jgi:hypothetical protein